MTHAYSSKESAPEFSALSYGDDLRRVQQTPKQDYETVEVPAEFQGNELGIIYKHPHEPVTDRVLMLVKGLGASRGAYLALQSAMAEAGYPVAAIKSPRKQDKRKALKCDHIKDPLIFQSQGLREVREAIHDNPTVTSLRDGAQATNFAYAGHSMGTPISVKSAYYEHFVKPDDITTIDRLVTIGGAGQNKMKLPHFVQSLGGLGLEIVRHAWEIKEAADDGFALDSLEHIGRSLPRVGREAIHVAGNAYVLDKMDALRADGVPIGAIVLNSDGAFNADRLEASLIGHTDYLARIDGPHVLPNSKPREFAPHLVLALESLDRPYTDVAPNLMVVEDMFADSNASS